MITSILFLLFPDFLLAQEDKIEYKFSIVTEVGTTKVKDQYRSGTCWDYAALSFFESEILRMKGKVYDLSEMYVVRCIYPLKAENYIRLHGNATFSSGGQSHDVLIAIREKGLVPEIVYPGLIAGDDKPNHGEMDAVLRAILKAVLKKESGTITPVWLKAFESVLDVYLGKEPEIFKYEGVDYSPYSFAGELGINPEDYIELTSFIHHPFYEPFLLEIPDNWSQGLYYNIPIDELIEIMDYALSNGYSVSWDGDVSEKGFSHQDGVAILPLKDKNEKSSEEKDNTSKSPEPEIEVTQEMRQETFNNQSTTDDHLMHITGIVKDQTGMKYYKTKNSWGMKRNDFGGYLNMSEAFVKLKTIAIMVHKDAIPGNIAKKLGL